MFNKTRFSIVVAALVAATPCVQADDPLLAPLDRQRWSLSDDTTLAASFRLQGDSASFSDSTIDSENGFRRARAALRLDHKDWRVGFDYDVGVSDGWKNVRIEYRGFRRQRIVVGNQVTPLSMEDLTSSSSLTFLERSAAATLAPGMLMGASYRRWWDSGSVHVGVFGDELTGQDRRRLPGASVIGRGTWAPLDEEGRTLHIGIGGEVREVDDNARVRLRARPGTRLTSTRLVDTRNITGVSRSELSHVEAAFALPRFRVQGEANLLQLDTDTGSISLSGHYVMVSVPIGAESYRYRSSRGTFDRLRPDGRYGAFEISARYGVVDLNDGSITGGQQTEMALGVSWILNRNLLFTLNQTQVEATPDRDGLAQDLDVTLLRVDFRM
ncbi:MAG: porin [Pseudomonadota bacterium]